MLRQATCAVTRLPLFDESNSALLPLFLPNLSPRNTALVACVDRGVDGGAAPAWPWPFGGGALDPDGTAHLVGTLSK